MKKRGDGDGTIFEERPGRWVAALTLGYQVVDGQRRRIRKKFTATTREGVRKKLTDALHKHQNGGVVPMQRGTLGAFLKEWLVTLRQKGREDTTLDSYAWMIEKYIEPELGHIRLTKLTQHDINRFMRTKVETGLTATARYAHRIIRSALSKAEKDDLVARNVAKLAEPPGHQVAKIAPMTVEEAQRFLVAVQGDRLAALYSVAFSIGLRRGEALGLELTGIDLARGALMVTQTLQRMNKKGIVLKPKAKTDKSLRMIPLPPFAIRALTAHIEQQKAEREFARDEWQEHGLVFATENGKPLDPRNVLRHLHTTLKTLKIDRRRFHDLRHTAASLLLAQGATLHDVKEILGHSQIRLTSDLYGHAYMAVKKEAVDRMDILDPLQPAVAPLVAPLAAPSRPN